jgi:hypothetical protein
MAGARLVVAISAVSALCGVAARDGLELRFGEHGSYSLRLGGGEPWLRSAPTTVRAGGKNYSTVDASLVLVSNHSATGCDAIGDFSSTTIAYTAGSVPFETEFRVYTTPVSAVVFEQRFPDGAQDTANNCSHSQATLLSAFPAFALDAEAAARPQGPQAYVQFAGRGVPTAGGCQMGPWPPNPRDMSAHSCQSGGSLDHVSPAANRLAGGWEAAGAIALFDGQANATLVLSPHAAFTTTQAVHTEEGVLAFGPRGSIESVPTGFTAGAIAVAGSGIGRTMRQWGLALMRKGGKDPNAWKADYSLKYLGYTTDNGAYYYYKTEDNKDYEETILDLKQYTLAQKIPVRWILYDSWFYSKANGSATGSGMMSPSHAALNWSDADPSVFPSGLRSVYRATGWPVVAHARAWASAKEGNVYAKADPTGWIESADTTGEVIGLPITSAFWDALFANAREWGCLQYQQDWMYTQASMKAMLTNATLARLWHMQMTDALARNGMRFGFGGVQPTDWLMSTEQPSVTNGRISDDYHSNLHDEGALNWNIGTASIFGWALSVIPAKDGWWSTPTQPGHPYKDNRTENLGALHAVVATLSRGPVSPADKLGLFNRTQIMRSCMEDGTLLSPDRPALALDSSLLYRALRGTTPTNYNRAAVDQAACKWSQPIKGKFLVGNVATPDPNFPTVAEAQDWCCSHKQCGGVTYQNHTYTVRQEQTPKTCDTDCDGLTSWVKNPLPPPPPPPPLQRKAPSAEIWTTHSTIGSLVYRHVLVPLNRAPYLLTPTELAENDGLKLGPSIVVENGDNLAPTTAVPFDQDNDGENTTTASTSGSGLEIPRCDRSDFKLYHVVPLLPNGWAVVGETAKWVPVSAARVRNVAYSHAATDGADYSQTSSSSAPVTVQISGVAGENISFGFVDASSASASDLEIQYAHCQFGRTGTLTVAPSGCVDRPW